MILLMVVFAAFGGLGEKIAKLPKDGDPKSLKDALPKGARLAEAADGFTISFDKPIDAAELIAAWSWKRPYAVSGDVHQTSWEIELWTQDLQDPYNTRIATDWPQMGVWRVRAHLTDRPEGALPKLVAGASPAYDLTTYKARVREIQFQRQ